MVKVRECPTPLRFLSGATATTLPRGLRTSRSALIPSEKYPSSLVSRMVGIGDILAFPAR